MKKIAHDPKLEDVTEKLSESFKKRVAINNCWTYNPQIKMDVNILYTCEPPPVPHSEWTEDDWQTYMISTATFVAKRKGE